MKIKNTNMNVLNTINKALPRVSALLTLFLINLSVIAQDSALTSGGTRASSGKWYDQGWVWFVIIIVAVILILALSRKTTKGPLDREQNRYKDKR